MSEKVNFVIDANIIRRTCRGKQNCKSILDKVRNYRVCFSRIVLNEYKAMVRSNDCMHNASPGMQNFVQNWFAEFMDKFGKRTDPEQKTPKCLKPLIKKGKFPSKDVCYVQNALKCEPCILVSLDYHFLHHGKGCIESLGVPVYDDISAVEYFDRKFKQ